MDNDQWRIQSEGDRGATPSKWGLKNWISTAGTYNLFSFVLFFYTVDLQVMF